MKTKPIEFIPYETLKNRGSEMSKSVNGEIHQHFFLFENRTAINQARQRTVPCLGPLSCRLYSGQAQ